MEFSKIDAFLREHMNIVQRLCPPTKICKQPYQTQWHVMRDGEPTIVYIQVSKDENQPIWARYSAMLEIMFFERTQDPVFIEECIGRYLYENKIPS